MIGVLFDIAVVYYAGGLELFDDEKKDNEEPTKALNRFVLKVNKTKYFPLRQNIDSRIQQQNQRHTDTHTHTHTQRLTSWAWLPVEAKNFHYQTINYFVELIS